MSRCACLEARPRVGGRTLDHPIGDGHVVEGGGQWVGPGHTRVISLAKELGVATFPSYFDGKLVILILGVRLFRKDDEADSADMKRVKHILETFARSVPLDAPWSAEHAHEWDNQSVADWLEKTPTTRKRSRHFVSTWRRSWARRRKSRYFTTCSSSILVEAFAPTIMKRSSVDFRGARSHSR